MERLAAVTSRARLAQRQKQLAAPAALYSFIWKFRQRPPQRPLKWTASASFPGSLVGGAGNSLYELGVWDAITTPMILSLTRPAATLLRGNPGCTSDPTGSSDAFATPASP
jgi:hypothetical protein